ncbi:MAG: metallophosphoesterase family protein [Clostridia bacterium]|nr:metallophosphoesterase family protein [Clostridia bacterium]
MNSFIARLRITINKIGIAIGGVFFNITFGMFPESMFCMSVKGHINTDVKVVSEDSESVTIAKFNKYGVMVRDDFKIIATTDLHLGDNPKLRRKAVQMLANHITNARPDLVVFTGDIILSRFQQVDAIQFAKLMEKIGIFWTICYGNHEAREDKGFFKRLLLEGIRTYPHCLVKNGPEELFGYGNHYINILNGENSIQQTLFLFDSGRDILEKYRESHGVPQDMQGYDFIKKDQIDWYKSRIDMLRQKYGDFKSMVFMHIPLPEYAEAITGSDEEGWTFTDKCRILYGSAYESVGCSPFNSGMFDAILEKEGTQAVFCGHDHVNDFCANYKGVFLVYNQCCGYETYGLSDKIECEEKDWPLGVTVILVHIDGSFDLAQRFNSMYLKEVYEKAQLEKQQKKKK